jgi:CO/xanthine dehydrogenase FAD-binding subunit
VLYYRPETREELSQLLRTLPLEETVLIAGGTDLHPAWEQGRPLPQHLVDMKRLTSLRGVRSQGEYVTMGALTTVEELKRDSIILTHFGALHQATRQFAGVQIRHRATLGGNLCNASPAGDLLPGLFVHNAEVQILGAEGERTLSVANFIQGPGKTVLTPGEIVTAVKLPHPQGKSMFYKLGLRQAMAIAVVNFAIAWEMDESGNFKTLTIAAGAVAPTVVYLKNFTCAILKGVSLKEALPLLDEDIAPIDDLRATAEYRRKVLKNLVGYYIDKILIGRKDLITAN